MNTIRTAPGSLAPAAGPPHAPERGWSWRLLGSFHVTGSFWYRLHLWGVRFLPSALIGVFLPIFTTFFFPVLRRIRAAIASNLEPVLGPCGWWERQRRIYRTMWSLAWCLTERYERLGTDRPFQVEVEGLEIWQRVALPGRGLLLVTAHLGNYEVGSLVPSRVEQRSVRVVREPEVDTRAQAFLEGVVAQFKEPGYSMQFQTDDPLQGMALLEVLRRGDIVAMQGDRPRAGARSIDITMFGRPFPLPPGPAALARAAEVPLLPVFVFREGRRRYRAVIREPISVARTKDRAADLAAAMTRVATEVEWAIRKAPHQWHCFRRLWA